MPFPEKPAFGEYAKLIQHIEDYESILGMKGFPIQHHEVIVVAVERGSRDQLRHHPDTMSATIADRWQQFQGLFDFEPVFIVNGTVPALSEMSNVA